MDIRSLSDAAIIELAARHGVRIQRRGWTGTLGVQRLTSSSQSYRSFPDIAVKSSFSMR
jgi:hypothetical protein